MVRTSTILAVGALGGGFLLLDHLLTNQQVELARELQGEVQQDLESEVSDPNAVSDQEANAHISQWQTVARQYYQLLDAEGRQSVDKSPNEFEAEVDGGTPQERALAWKSYAAGVLRAFEIENTGQTVIDEWVGRLADLVIWGTALVVVVKLVQWGNRNSPPPGEIRDRLSDYREWVNDVLEPETAPEPVEDVEDVADEPPAESGQTVAQAQAGDALSALPDQVADAVGAFLSIPLTVPVVVTSGTVSILASISDKGEQWWLDRGALTLIGAVLVVLAAGVAIGIPDPLTTAAGLGLLGALGAFLGVQFFRNQVANQRGALRESIQIG